MSKNYMLAPASDPDGRRVDDHDGARPRVPAQKGKTPGKSRLPPLGSRVPITSGDQHRTIPPIAPMTGSHAQSPQEGLIISVPKQQEGYPPRPGPSKMMGTAEQGVPGRERTAGGKAIAVVVYFVDKSGLTFTVEDGHNAQAGELFEMVMAELNLAPVARDAFSLWLVSDLLELQLKPHHVPFKLACYWEELLEKYTEAEEADIERDEPVVMFQRNVFYTRAQERQLDDNKLLGFLYSEAKENVIDAHYPITADEADYLAGIQAVITHKSFNVDVHTSKYYKSRYQEYYPEHLCKRSAIFGSKEDRPENRVATSHMRQYNRMKGPTEHETVARAQRAYLEFCWKLPYYGAVFFRGQIEHPGRKFSLRSSVDDPVYVAINTDGVFIVDMDDVTFLLGLLYEDLKWQYAEPKDRENRNCMPCLFLEFSDKLEGEKVQKILQIFSREAVLMDALIEACIKLRTTGGIKNDRTLDMLDGKEDGKIQFEGKAWNKFNRLCLMTMSKEGEVRHSTLRRPKQSAQKA